MAVIQAQSTSASFDAKNTTTKIVVNSFINSVGTGSSSGNVGTTPTRPTEGQLFPRGLG